MAKGIPTEFRVTLPDGSVVTVPAKVADVIAGQAIERFVSLVRDEQFDLILGTGVDGNQALCKGLMGGYRQAKMLLSTSNLLIRAERIEAVFSEEASANAG